MKSVIIGTAGHVDHGKTMLIRALTGKDTDRLREEKERGISIDLGFAPFRLPGGRLAGVVDVPGHEKFIHNMLAGVAGIDLVILVVDAAEGVMPQTREHLEILQLLEVKKGIVVITKIDLVEEDWLDLVEEEIKEEFKGTFLEDSLIHRVSVVTGTGLEDLKILLDRLVEEVPTREQGSPLRLPVDRVFAVPGFGTVVTGTLVSGSVAAGEVLEILPQGIEARLRQVQVFDTQVEKAVAGQRVALNLAGIEKASLERGNVVARRGFFQPTRLVDARLKLLPGRKRPLVNLSPVHFYLGASRVVAKVLLLDREELAPGESALVQCRLDRPVVTHYGDRFIIRSYSPMTTIGGGIVLDGQPVRQKRFREEVLARLEILEKGDPRELLLQKLKEKEIMTARELEISTKFPGDIIQEEIEKLTGSRRVIYLAGSLVLAEKVEQWKERVVTALRVHYRRDSLSPGLPKAQLKSLFFNPLGQKAYDAFLGYMENLETLETRGEVVSLFGYEVRPGEREQTWLNTIENMFKEKEFSPPSRKEWPDILKVQPEIVDRLINYLQEKGAVVKISEEVFLHRESYGECLLRLKEWFRAKEEITVSDFKNLLDTSRKYALPLLEHFDQRKLTRRVDDKRVPWKIRQQDVGSS